MRRAPIAAVTGIIFVLLYVIAALILPEQMPRMSWPVEAIYWCVAGLLWVLPVRWLMLWAAAKR